MPARDASSLPMLAPARRHRSPAPTLGLRLPLQVAFSHDQEEYVIEPLANEAEAALVCDVLDSECLTAWASSR